LAVNRTSLDFVRHGSPKFPIRAIIVTQLANHIYANEVGKASAGQDAHPPLVVIFIVRYGQLDTIHHLGAFCSVGRRVLRVVGLSSICAGGNIMPDKPREMACIFPTPR